MSAATSQPRRIVVDDPSEDTSPNASARFRIKIDNLGRIIPEVVPVDEDATNDADS